jgi:hypothetical protein
VVMGRYDDAKKTLDDAIRINKDDPQARVELANLYLQTGEIKEAVCEGRQAVASAPGSDSAVRALAIALIRTEDYGEAEKVLREALRKQDESKRWQFHLTLSQLLTRLGDKTSEDEFYEEALKEVKTAIHLKPNAPELHFHKGILSSRCKDPRGALTDFEECINQSKRLGTDHFEAERYARLVRKELRDDIHRGSRVASWTVVVIATLMLSVLWFSYFVRVEAPPQPPHDVAAIASETASAAGEGAAVKGGKPPTDDPVSGYPLVEAIVEVTSPTASDANPSGEASLPNAATRPAELPVSKETVAVGRVSETTLTVLTPLLLGMIVVGFLLPALIRLKFAGVEAELTQPKEVISTGPKGEVNIGGSLSTIKQ